MRALLLALIAASLAGCGGVDCAEGTFKDGDNCIGHDPNDSTAPTVTIEPPGRRSRDPLPATAVISTDETATIFVTTDGSDPDPATGTGGASPIVIADIADGTVVKFIAIDRAGNASEIQTATYFSDTTAPAGVADLAITLGGANGDEATITWTNPTDDDFAGTVLARVVDLVDTEPEDGELIATAGGSLSSSLQILQVGTGTSFVDPGVALGTARYVVWSHDDLGNYSQPVAARAERDIGNLQIQLSYNTNNDQLTTSVTSPALDITAESSRSSNTVTIDLTVSNITNKVFQNPKLEVIATSNATFANSDGTADGRAFKSLGPGALPPAVPRTKQLVLNVIAGTTATIDLELAQHASLVFERNRQASGQGGFIDMETLLEQPAFTPPAGGNNNRGGRLRPGVLVGERFFDIPTSHGAIERWDLATNTRVAGVVLAQSSRGGGGNDNRSNILGLYKTEANVFAVLKSSSHRSPGELTVVRLNEGLKETGRLDLSLQFDRGIASMAMSSEGVLAIPVNTQIVLVDTRTLRVIDTAPATPDNDLIQTGLQDRIRSLVFLGPNRIASLSRQSGQLAITDFDGTTATTALLSQFSGRGHQLAVAPDGRLWIAIDSGLRIYNPTDGAISNPGYGAIPGAITFVNGQLLVLRNNRTTLDRVNPATGVIARSTGLPFTIFQHWLFSTSP